MKKKVYSPLAKRLEKERADKTAQPEPAHKPKPKREHPIAAYKGKLVTIQTRAPQHLTGTLVDFQSNWLMFTSGAHVNRVLPDGTSTAPVLCSNLSIDAGTVQYIAEVSNES